MKLALAEPKYLKESISLISDLVNEARFKVTPDAVELIAMDPASVAMVVFKLLSSAFIEYNVKQPETLCINLSNLKQILRRAKPNDMVTLELDDNKLKIQLKSNNIRTFHLPLIDMEEKEQRIPELSFPVKVHTDSKVLIEAIEDVDIIGESVVFSVEPGKFSISAEGDLSKANIEMKASDQVKIEAKTEEKIRAKYSIEYLKKMIGGAKIADEVNIQFNKDYPLRLDYNTMNRVSLTFILAPRVEND
ncbi:TPA: proliferating cell nuclear antigen (pcna) [Candidatus Woesearchaeota archaeon]|nr:proliferating cell nuclear antigen (pcna) [Candidatus Woesearchaeota archaeon]